MLWLIKMEIAPARQPDFGDGSPPGFLNSRAGHFFGGKRRHFGLEVIAHQIKGMTAVGLGRVERRLRRRQGEDQPAVPGVHMRKSQHVAEEGAIGLGIGRIDDHVGARNHVFLQWVMGFVVGIRA